MTDRGRYVPGPAHGARIGRKEGDRWTLVLVRELRHPPEAVWEALTDPEQLREWAPFDADGNLGAPGRKVRLTTVGAPKPHMVETRVVRAERPRLLEYNWGGGDLRWELEDLGGRTRLTLWADIGRRYVAMGASGWHICLDVLDSLLGGDPFGRIVGPAAMQVEGWHRLHSEYAEQFGVDMPNWPPRET